MTPITPEPINLDDRPEHSRYAAGHWDYPTRCADIELSLTSVREIIEEWDPADLYGWWHERPRLIALYNEIVRLRAVE